MQVVNIIGWILYVLVILYSISSITYYWNVSKVERSITFSGLF